MKWNFRNPENLNNSITRRRGERGEFRVFLSVSAPPRDSSLVLMKSLKFYGSHYSLITNPKLSPVKLKLTCENTVHIPHMFI